MRPVSWQRLVSSSTAAAFLAAVAVPQNLAAQAAEHVVSPGDLQKATVDASRARSQNLDTLNRFFSSDQAQKALQSAHINPQEVNTAVAGLSDEELAQFASRAQKAQNDFAAGNIGDHDLLIILVCIAALILIIVAVH
ncbi:MAG: PA2779 family protein [Terracidiphilus sp.]